MRSSSRGRPRSLSRRGARTGRFIQRVCKLLQHDHVSTVALDEASQVWQGHLLSLLSPFPPTARLVVVGDDHQLPSHGSNQLDHLAGQHRDCATSVFDATLQYLGEEGVHTLHQSYRLAPEVRSILSSAFYRGQLKTVRDAARDAHVARLLHAVQKSDRARYMSGLTHALLHHVCPLPLASSGGGEDKATTGFSSKWGPLVRRLVWLHVPGSVTRNESRSSGNSEEAAAVSRIAGDLVHALQHAQGQGQQQGQGGQGAHDSAPLRIACISAYAAQTNSIKAGVADTVRQLDATCSKQVGASWQTQCIVGNTDSLQGQEADVCIVSLVRCESPGYWVGFLDDNRRNNVMLSRSSQVLVLVGDLLSWLGTGVRGEQTGVEAEDHRAEAAQSPAHDTLIRAFAQYCALGSAVVYKANPFSSSGTTLAPVPLTQGQRAVTHYAPPGAQAGEVHFAYLKPLPKVTAKSLTKRGSANGRRNSRRMSALEGMATNGQQSLQPVQGTGSTSGGGRRTFMLPPMAASARQPPLVVKRSIRVMAGYNAGMDGMHVGAGQEDDVEMEDGQVQEQAGAGRQRRVVRFDSALDTERIQAQQAAVTSPVHRPYPAPTGMVRLSSVPSTPLLLHRVRSEGPDAIRTLGAAGGADARGQGGPQVVKRRKVLLEGVRRSIEQKVAGGVRLLGHEYTSLVNDILIAHGGQALLEHIASCVPVRMRPLPTFLATWTGAQEARGLGVVRSLLEWANFTVSTGTPDGRPMVYLPATASEGTGQGHRGSPAQVTPVLPLRHTAQVVLPLRHTAQQVTVAPTYSRRVVKVRSPAVPPAPLGLPFVVGSAGPKLSKKARKRLRKLVAKESAAMRRSERAAMRRSMNGSLLVTVRR